MKLNTTQVAERLGISRDRVHTLIKNGTLTDIKPKKEGSKKHFPLVDSKQVNEYLKANRGVLKAVKRFRSIAKPVIAAPTGPGVVSRLEDRLGRIEAKLDALVAMWQ